MNTIKQILTHDNLASSARCIDYMGITITDANYKPLEGEVKLKDGTICRFKNGLLDGNVYNSKGEITEIRPAMEYEFGGTEYCKKGLLDGFPAVIQNFGYTEEDWNTGTIHAIRNEVRLESLE